MSPKISLSSKSLDVIDKKYCRITFTEEPLQQQRFVQQKDGGLVYRVGVGKWSQVSLRQFRTIIRHLVQVLKSQRITHIVIDSSIFSFPAVQSMDEQWQMSTLVENILLANYEFTLYKTKTKDYTGIKEILLTGVTTKNATTGMSRGLIVGTAVNEARDIANTHGDDMTPASFATTAKKIAKGTSVTVSVLNRAKIRQEKLNLLHAVGKGSHNEEQFIIMEYWGKKKPTTNKITATDQPLVLIGKGITYDTGGLNVKPAGHMHDMHMDMSGGSSVMTAIIAAAKLGIKKNIIALIPTAENAISSHSMRAGDIVTAHNGTTVEILHTDAEGRLVLADALSYSTRYQPRAIIDVATLTGAALVALGQHASAIMTTDTAFETTLRELGEDTGDLLWPLPLWDEYQSSIKSTRADIANIASNFSKFAGAIEGGIFLTHFAPKNVPWAHIDIAPRMDSIPSDKLAKGSTGEPVRLLIKWLETY